MGEININFTYPRSDKYEFRTELKRINLDKEKDESILSGNGFLITQSQSTLKKDLRSPFGIFSPKFGATLQDQSPLMDNCRCLYGCTTKRINLGTICPKCGTMVEEVEDNFNYFGWMVLDDLYTIHPNLYKALQSYIGKAKFENIIKPVNQKDENGHTVATVVPKGEPFFGLGIMGFKDHFMEIMKYYYKPNKKDKYDNIIKDIDKVFTHSIPVNCIGGFIMLPHLNA